jgi:putative flippase GtrA
MPVQVIPFSSNGVPVLHNGHLASPATITQKPSSFLLSVIVPTRNEAGNIKEFVRRIERVANVLPLELIFVDDSTDETPEMIKNVAAGWPYNVMLIHRPPEQRSDGLGGAVVTGFRAASGSWVCVMDADLQHPPELIIRLLRQAKLTNADLVMASRLSEEADVSNLGFLRTTVSHSLINVARLIFPGRLGQVSDPLTGFFAFRKSAVDIDALNPNGFKILLEILVRFPELRWCEVPFEFGKRFAGESKADSREVLRYFSLLSELRFGGKLERFIKFGLVGASGIGVNLASHALLTDLLGIHYLTGAVLATQSSSLWNFILTESWVFGDRRPEFGLLSRMAQFFALNNAALLLRGPIMYGLTSNFGLHYLLSNFISIMALMVVRYGLSEGLIWKEESPAPTTKVESLTSETPKIPTALQKSKISIQKDNFIMPYNYNIHDIISVASDVRLPELELFMTDELFTTPTIRVQIGYPDHQSINGSKNRIAYREILGRLGFKAEIRKGETIEVIASPPLRHSPHVLYTNLVEPILRWTFVEKGYALIHGACLSVDGKAYLVTARTDTGKTTTILCILDRQRRETDQTSFLSDDLTLVSPNGEVMTYPKPLTISAHTVQAVNTPVLSWRERLTLPLQSRLHSRAGRRIGLLLARTPMPMASINMMIQAVVPPPKYNVQRLVPSAKMSQKAKLAGLFVIERGGKGDRALGQEEAVEIVLENCEDAYGFPPYNNIAGFLYGSNGTDLRRVEQGIITQAIAGLPSTLLRSDNYDWAERIVHKLEQNGAPVNGSRQTRRVSEKRSPVHA